MLLVDGSGTVIASKTTMFYQDELGGGLHTGGAVFSILHSSQFNGLLCGIWLVYWTNCPFFCCQKKCWQTSVLAVTHMFCTVNQSRVNDCILSGFLSSEN